MDTGSSTASTAEEELNDADGPQKDGNNTLDSANKEIAEAASAHEKLLMAVHYACMRISDEVVEEVLKERGEKLEFDCVVIAQTAKLVMDALCDTWPADLLAFAGHGKRPTVNTDDVLMLVRRNKSLVAHMESAIQSFPSSRQSSSVRRRVAATEQLAEGSENKAPLGKAVSNSRRGRPLKTPRTVAVDSDGFSSPKITSFLNKPSTSHMVSATPSKVLVVSNIDEDTRGSWTNESSSSLNKEFLVPKANVPLGNCDFYDQNINDYCNVELNSDNNLCSPRKQAPSSSNSAVTPATVPKKGKLARKKDAFADCNKSKHPIIANHKKNVDEIFQKKCGNSKPEQKMKSKERNLPRKRPASVLSEEDSTEVVFLSTPQKPKNDRSAQEKRRGEIEEVNRTLASTAIREEEEDLPQIRISNDQVIAKNTQMDTNPDIKHFKNGRQENAVGCIKADSAKKDKVSSNSSFLDLKLSRPLGGLSSPEPCEVVHGNVFKSGGSSRDIFGATPSPINHADQDLLEKEDPSCNYVNWNEIDKAKSVVAGNENVPQASTSFANEAVIIHKATNSSAECDEVEEYDWDAIDVAIPIIPSDYSAAKQSRTSLKISDQKSDGDVLTTTSLQQSKEKNCFSAFNFESDDDESLTDEVEGAVEVRTSLTPLKNRNQLNEKNESEACGMSSSEDVDLDATVFD